MRSFIDENKCVAWVFDEYTHPKGLFYNKKPVAPVVASKPVVVVHKPKKK